MNKESIFLKVILFHIFCNFLALDVQCQVIQLLDFESKKPIIYAKIQGYKNGCYTDSAGFFDLKEIDSTCFCVYHISYESACFCKNRLLNSSQILYLSPKTDTLIMSHVKPMKKIDIGFLKPSRGSYTYMPMAKNYSLQSIIIPDERIAGARIDKVFFRFMNSAAENTYNFKFCKSAILRLNFYDRDMQMLFSTEAKKFVVENYKQAFFDLTSYDVFLDKAGIIIEIEAIELSEEDKPVLYVQLTRARSTDYFMESTIKHSFGESIVWQHEVDTFRGKKSNVNMAFDLSK